MSSSIFVAHKYNYFPEIVNQTQKVRWVTSRSSGPGPWHIQL